jgi:hypothetical protein
MRADGRGRLLPNRGILREPKQFAVRQEPYPPKNPSRRCPAGATQVEAMCVECAVSSLNRQRIRRICSEGSVFVWLKYLDDWPVASPGARGLPEGEVGMNAGVFTFSSVFALSNI